MKHALFAFLPPDYEAARQWLTKLYEEGWELEKLSWFAFLPARFVPRTRDDLKYCVDVTPYNGKSQIAPDGYDRLVADSGWELIDCSNGLNVYKSKPGTDPAPIHTDPDTARKRFWRVEVLPSLLVLLVLLGAMAFPGVSIARSGRPFNPFSILASNWELIRTAPLLLLLPWCLFLILHTVVFWLRSRRGTNRPASLRAARTRALLTVGAWILIWFTTVVPPLGIAFTSEAHNSYPDDPAAYPVLSIEDTDLGACVSASVSRRASVVVEELTVKQWLAVGVTLSQTRYDCRFSWVADVAVSACLAQARADRLSPAPAELGFDESWTDGDYLLLRQGDVVAELSGPLDMTSPDILVLIRTHLELG